MKIASITIALLLVSEFCFCQIPFYDALALKRAAEKENLTVKINPDSSNAIYIDSILCKYVPKQHFDTCSTEAGRFIVINKAFNGNDFLSVSSKIQNSSNEPINIYNDKSSIEPSIKFLDNLDVTTLADGFAKFIVARTKLELNIAFFARFQEEIEKPEYKDLQTIFPQTYRALTAIGEEIYNYEGYLQTLRECFKNDLNNLTITLPSIVDNHPDFFAKFPELEALLNSGCYLASELKSKMHPGDILNSYPVTYLNKLSPNSKGAIQTLQLISASLRKFPTDDKSYWVSTAELNSLIDNKIAFRIYLGLIYQQALQPPYNSIQFKNTTLVAALSQLAKNFDNDYDKYAEYLYQFEGKVNSLKQLMDSYDPPMKDSLAVEFYAKYANASLDIFKQASQVGKLPYINLPQLADTLGPFFNIAQASFDLAVAINRRNYGGAIANCAYIYNTVIPKNITITEKEYNDAKKKITEKIGNAAIEYAKRNGNFNNCSSIDSATQKYLNQYATILYNQNNDTSKKRERCKAKKEIKNIIGKLAIDSIKRFGNLNGFSFSNKAELQPYVNTIYSYTKLDSIPKPSKETINKIYKYGTFMATVAQAKTSDEVKEAIDAIALPPGSARTKRESAFNVSLNAYCGIYAGYEKIKGFDMGYHGINFSKWNSYGITAPIGIAVSKGCSHMSYSIFVSAVDIGALAAFRFTNDSTSTAPKVELKDIISPGLFFSYGLPNCPISVNVGYQLGPLLRNVSATQNSYYNSYTRFSVSICVDIPVLNLYNKPH